MNKQKILEKYKKRKTHIPRWLLKNGSVVIAEEVDEENRLHYVIKRGDEFKIEYAGEHRPIANLVPKERKRIAVKLTEPEK